MKKIQLVLLFIFISVVCVAQDKEKKEEKERADENGQFQFGMRSSMSLFDHQSYPGLGFGGQFRIRLGKRLNTEWYADYIKTDIGGLGYRETGHIGWSVMFFPLETEAKKGNIVPYVIGGHCFDYARINTNIYLDPVTHELEQNSVERWTTAVQMGLGLNYYISDKVDLSFTTQYMSHIGNDLHVDVYDADGDNVGHDHGAASDHLVINEEPGTVLEGHLLMTLSINIQIADFIK